MDNRVDVNQKQKKPLLVLAVTSAMSMVFFKGQLEFLKEAGFDIVVVCSPGWESMEGVKYYPIAMEREIAVFKDLHSLYLLIKLFLSIKPQIVNAGTPKAGLLASIAAFISGVPIRVYTCHGLRLETLVGWRRRLLTTTERIAAFCANRVVCVSNSLRCKFIALGLAPEHKVTVIGAGSCNGVDVNTYQRIGFSDPKPGHIFQDKDINKDPVFIGFIGRLTKDKGIYELVEAFEILKKKFPNLYLLLIGGFEDGDPITENNRQKILQDERIINVGFIDDTLPYYHLMDLFILPTYREGLPTVLLEAGAMGIPAVATRATGCVDIVVDGETGLLVPIGDGAALAKAVELLLTDEMLALRMGQAARRRITQLYNQELVWKNVEGFYKGLLAEEKSGRHRERTDAFLKRVVDLVISGTLLALLWPVLLLVGIIIGMKIGTPVFFKQQRPGLDAKPFYIYKFRTMTEERDAQGCLLPDEHRLTKLGAIIRKLSLDELPQLFNVFKGELSLVGPRPLLMEYLRLYTPEQARRHQVKPGITGWAQVNGRNALSWTEKFKLDVWYVDNRSLCLDLKILWLTVLKVLAHEGINQHGQATMEKFRGIEECQDC